MIMSTPPELGRYDVTWQDETHTVVVICESGGSEFLCETCEASGLTDGYLTTEDGAQEWHDDTTDEGDEGDDEGEES